MGVRSNAYGSNEGLIGEVVMSAMTAVALTCDSEIRRGHPQHHRPAPAAPPLRLTSRARIAIAVAAPRLAHTRDTAALSDTPALSDTLASRDTPASATRRRAGRHAGRSSVAASFRGSSARTSLPPVVRWSTVTTTSSTYIDVLFPQVVFTDKLIGEHKRRSGR